MTNFSRQRFAQIALPGFGRHGLSAVISLCILFTSAQVPAGEVAEAVLDRSITTRLPIAAKAIIPLSGTQALIEPETSADSGSVLIVDLRTGENIAKVPVSGELLALQRYSSPQTEGFGIGVAMLVKEGESRISLEIVAGENPRNLQFQRKRLLSMYLPEAAVLQELDGRSFAVWDEDFGAFAVVATNEGGGVIPVPLGRKVRAIQPTGDEATVLAIDDRGASLVDTRFGAVVESISVADLQAPIATFASPPGDDGNRKVLVLSGTSDVLTVLTAQGTEIKRLAPPAQILTFNKQMLSGRPLLAADAKLQRILVGREGSAQLLAFRQVGVAIERFGVVHLERPIVSIATLSKVGPNGSDVFAFLGEDRRTLDLIPQGMLALQSDPQGKPYPNFEDAERILAVQRTLAKLGYQVGIIDGMMGPATRSAVRAFQLTTDLDATGEIDDATFSAITEAALTGGSLDDVTLEPKPDSGVDPGEHTIYVQFAGIMKREEVNALIARLRRSGWKVPAGAERIKAASGLNEVRFGPSSDGPAAEALAAALNETKLLEREVYAKQVSVVRPRILELWISR